MLVVSGRSNLYSLEGVVIMPRSKMQSGYMELEGKSYIFTYDGELLQLVPKEQSSIKPYDFLANKNIHLEVLEGTTIGFEKIFFLNCFLKVNRSGYIAKPSGFVCFDGNERCFDTITFKGGIIDYFYRPNHIIDEKNTCYNYFSGGGGEIKLRPFDEISKECEVEVDGKKANLVLSVTLPGEPINMQVDYNLGKPKSILKLCFEEEIDVTYFRTIYMWIYNLMSFVNFRKNIRIGEISLGIINDKGKNAPIAYTHIIDLDKEDIVDIDQIIGYYFVFDHINDLIQIVNKKDLNLLFIPKNLKSGKYVTPESYMICCTSFESVFNYVFPNAKTEYSQKANEVKEEFFQFIEKKDEEYKGADSKKRKEFKKYADMIKLLDFGLGEKFEHCQTKFDKLTVSYRNRMLMKFGLRQEEINDMPNKFAKMRNLLMHSSLEEMEDIHVYAYTLARVYIYIMIMKQAKIEDNLIIQAIDLIF